MFFCIFEHPGRYLITPDFLSFKSLQSPLYILAAGVRESRSASTAAWSANRLRQYKNSRIWLICHYKKPTFSQQKEPKKEKKKNRKATVRDGALERNKGTATTTHGPGPGPKVLVAFGKFLSSITNMFAICWPPHISKALASTYFESHIF